MKTNGHRLDEAQLAAKNGYPDPEHNDHTCPGCGAPVDCEFKRIIEVRRAARSMIAIASSLEQKLSGQSRSQRKHDFSNDDAKALYEKLGSFRAVSRALGATIQTVQRAVLPREQWPKAIAYQRVTEKLPEGVTVTRREK